MVRRCLPELLTVLVVLGPWHQRRRDWSTVDARRPGVGSGRVAVVAALTAMVAGGARLRRDPNRLRTGLIELRLTTRAGRLPLVLWLAPTPVGERVWLWCPAGISPEDIADEIDGIRAACCARDIRVTRDRRWAALVTVDVIRRDPLAAATRSRRRWPLARRGRCDRRPTVAEPTGLSIWDAVHLGVDETGRRSGSGWPSGACSSVASRGPGSRSR